MLVFGRYKLQDDHHIFGQSVVISYINHSEHFDIVDTYGNFGF